MATEQVQKLLSVTMGNKTPSEMRKERTHIWSGPPITFPAGIPANGESTLIRGKDTDSKAVVVYMGHNADGLLCAWLLAWDAPAPAPAPAPTLPPPHNKVFVICGSRHALDGLSFDEIEKMLDKATTNAEFADLATKTCADAKIDDLVTENATVVANFGLLP